MTLSLQSKRNIRSILIFTSFTTGGAMINAVISQGFKFYPIINEFFIGLLFGLITSISEIYFLEEKLRRMRFSTALLIRTTFYVVICALIIIAVGLSRIGSRVDSEYYDIIEHHGSLIAYITSGEFIELLIYSVLLSFFVNFIRQINRLLGQNVLLNYVRGKYQLPLEEELIFMFLDLKSSTTIAEKIGLKKNHEFLNDFFYDMTEPILEFKGRIYQYVGDEIVLTWTMKDGIKNANCIECFFRIQKNIQKKKAVYMEKFGVYPEFKAGLHFGKVITGEIGEIKKDIVYHGDTVNTSSRIQTECNTYNKILLISKNLLDKLNLEDKYKAESMGNIKLRGKEKELELCSIEEIS
ncbi:MAG: adenylate/guanylate cyclase domain-containing protein [Bacteroidota bacterium]|nr:adenylate/guanylate cyclase domain-containing protein [Bacteroidota bacterium]